MLRVYLELAAAIVAAGVSAYYGWHLVDRTLVRPRPWRSDARSKRAPAVVVRIVRTQRPAHVREVARVVDLRIVRPHHSRVGSETVH